VLENVFGPATLGKVENIDASYELLGRGIYSSSNTKIENAIFGIDRKTRSDFLKRATPYASRTSPSPTDMPLPRSLRRTAAPQRGRGLRAQERQETVIAAAREVVETAEEARVMAGETKSRGRRSGKNRRGQRAAEEREAKARADAVAEAQRRQEAEQARQASGSRKAEPCGMQQEAQKAPPRPLASKPKPSRPAPQPWSSNRPASRRRPSRKNRAAAQAQQRAAEPKPKNAPRRRASRSRKSSVARPASQPIEFHFADSRLRPRPHRQHVGCAL